MGTRLYPDQFSDALLTALLGCQGDRLTELRELDDTVAELQKLIRGRDGDVLDFGLWKLVQESPQLSLLQNLQLYGFGKFDTGCLPAHMRTTGKLSIEHKLARQLVDSSTHAQNHPGLYMTLVLAGCKELTWG